jgi:hypothetical protein
MKRLLTFALYYFMIFHFTCSPTPNNIYDPNANYFGMLMNLLGFDSFQKEQSAAQASTQVTGILRDANGDPLAFAILDLSLLQGKSTEGNLTRVISDTRTKTDADGAYILKLRLGKFEIGVTKADGTKMGSFSLDVVNSNVPPTVTTTSNTFAVSGVGISSIGSAPPSITSAKLESITYTNSTIYQNIATVITPKIKGGKPTSCTISPALPTGLSLNSTNCVISGKPTVIQSATNYIVTASNNGGSVFTGITIAVSAVSLPAYVSMQTGLLKTGQTTSYTTGDDGYYQKGLARNFVSGGSTGLIWQRCSAGQNDDASCSGTAQTYTWDGANSYCNTFSLARKIWRLPMVNDLADLVDYGKSSSPAIDTSTFPNTQSNFYWSSSTYAQSTSYAWGVSFYSGYVYSYNKTYNLYVRCVTGP